MKIPLISAAIGIAIALPSPVLSEEKTQEQTRNDILTTLLQRMLALKEKESPTGTTPSLPITTYPQPQAPQAVPMPYPVQGNSGMPSVLVIPITTGTGGSDNTANAMLMMMMMERMEANKPAPPKKKNLIGDVLTSVSAGFAKGAAENLANQLF